MSIEDGRETGASPPAKAGASGSMPVLAPYAVEPRSSRGRLIDEPPSDTRSPYARDRDRILHTTAFRRLNYKTQVFIYHEGDHYRSRLTHSLEVAQIARALARTLRVDEDLTEGLALAHDLGHPPFGHAGERALDAAMSDAGGFDHNAQSLRVVTELEKKYARFDGLNLTWETLEGLVKHNGPLTGPKAARHETAPVPDSILAYCAKQDLELATFASIEAQAAALADDIAYNNHDIDDGFRAGLFTFAELGDVPIAARALAQVRGAYPGIDGTRLLYEAIRRLITWMIEDAVAESERRLAELAPRSAGDVRHAADRHGRLLADDAGRSRPAPRFSRDQSLPPSAHRQHHAGCRERGPRPVPALQRRPRGAAPGMARPGAAARHAGPCPAYLRFHRRHDRPLCAGRASPLV